MPNVGRYCSSAVLGQTWTGLDQIWAGIGKTWTELDHMLVDLDRLWGRFRPTAGRIGPGLGQLRGGRIGMAVSVCAWVGRLRAGVAHPLRAVRAVLCVGGCSRSLLLGSLGNPCSIVQLPRAHFGRRLSVHASRLDATDKTLGRSALLRWDRHRTLRPIDEIADGVVPDICRKPWRLLHQRLGNHEMDISRREGRNAGRRPRYKLAADMHSLERLLRALVGHTVEVGRLMAK